jgi:septum formation protein
MKKTNLMKHVILASQSPRRVDLLKQMGIDCMVMSADIDETAKVNESPTVYVARLAKQKALAVLKKLDGQHAYLPIIAADTTVALENEIFGKPKNDDDAFKMLKKLSGTTHQVHTAVVLAFSGKIEKALNTTNVEMMRLTDARIKAFIATGEHRDKAGSYGIQGLAGSWIKHIEGSYTGVMGLPVHETSLLLDKISKMKA